jgi:hypothetical protein
MFDFLSTAVAPSDFMRFVCLFPKSDAPGNTSSAGHERDSNSTQWKSFMKRRSGISK